MVRNLSFVVVETEEGTPQGGPLSPLLANIVLDELDKKIERRGLRFVRYAADIAIYVRSRPAAARVLRTVNLVARGVWHHWAMAVGNTRKGAWRLSKHATVCQALPDSYFTRSSRIQSQN